MRFFHKLFMVTLITCTACMAAKVTRGQTYQYPVSAIDTGLLTDANSVVRLSTVEINVKDPQNATVHYHQVYTALNQKAMDVLTFWTYNYAFKSLDAATIHVYNKDGLLIQKYGKKDLMNTSFGAELIDDGSYTYFKVSPPSYPITVEYDYTIRYKGIMQYPPFDMQDPRQSVEKSSYQITLPTALGFRYKNFNTKISPQKKTLGPLSTYSWTVKDLPAITLESDSGPKYQYLPIILVAADQFSMDDYAGKMDTWAHFGDWLTALNKKDADLKPEQIAFYQSLTAGAATPEAKARIIYDYLQHNMRYVSIQLGIGGWKPLPAALVSTKKYGDCKALSHFMHAALAAVGIQSYPAVISMDKPDLPVSKDFPFNVFDHVVLCIPHLKSDKDTTWLECTSQLIDFGQLHYTTAGNYALLLTPEGGKLIHAPLSSDGQNILKTREQIHLHADGTASQQVRFTGIGAYKEMFLYNFYQEQTRDKKDFLNQYLGLKETDSVQIEEQPKGLGPYTIDLNMKYDQYPDFISGNKLFVSSRPFSRYISTPDEDSTRQADYYFSFPHKLQDTTVFILDEGLKPESVPESTKQRTDFGNYSSTYNYDAASRRLTIISQLDINKYTVKADQFKQLVDFAGKVSGDIQEKIVFLKE